jgi:hypothetical protein
VCPLENFQHNCIISELHVPTLSLITAWDSSNFSYD